MNSISSPTNSIIIGIDVAKDKLDIWLSHKVIDSKQHYVIANEVVAIKAFIEELVQKEVEITLIVMEYTGGYEQRCAQVLSEAGFKVHLAHPNQVYHFAKAKGLFAKTDKLDAKTLALYGTQKEIRATDLKSKLEAELAYLSSRRSQLSDFIIVEKMRCKDHLPESGRASHKRMIRQAEEELRNIEEDIDKLIRASEIKSERARCLQSFKGIGKKTAHQLVASLPELGTMSRSKIGALVGLAPKNKDSGNKRGYRAISGGRSEVRKGLYMVALGCIQYNNQMKAYYENLLAKGKKKKVALVAVMRKIIITLNAMIRDQRDWQQIA